MNKKPIKKNYIKLNDVELAYTFRKYKLSKRLRLTIRADASIAVTAPLLFSQRRAEKFMREKASWIVARVKHYSMMNAEKETVTGVDDYKKKKEVVRKRILIKLQELNQPYGFKFKGVSIRNQKTRWGSCSSKGNLNFNYRLIYLANHLFEYVLVHELCHLKEMNHSPRFWALVATTIPDYRQARRELKREGLALF